MTKDKSLLIADDWWPSSLANFSQENPLSDEHVVVAEISGPWGPGSDKQLYTALVPSKRIPELLIRRGCLAHTVHSTGPYPCCDDGVFQYRPEFWIHGAEEREYFEPLVVSWEAGSKRLLLPDQGFLMTYGLLPRHCDNGETVWDDPRNRVFEVVKSDPPSEYHFKLLKGSRVSIRREYLEDYATVRNMSLLQTYYVRNIDRTPDSLSSTVARSRAVDLRVPCRMLDLRTVYDDPEAVLAQVWGYRHLLDPGKAPVSIDKDYGRLNWPGYGIVDGRKGMQLDHLPAASEYVYVSDAVLGEYEGWPGFKICPESGAVYYDPQWSVSCCDRIGRDLIQVELKKLYEGNGPKTVKTWHKYCAMSPSGRDFARLRAERNIALRAKFIVYGMADLGKVLAAIISSVLGIPRTSYDVVGLDRATLDRHGWWEDEIIEPITRHAPINMREDEFLARCVDLYKIVGESLREKLLRQTLISLGSDEEALKGLGRLMLLDRLVQLAIIAGDSGLNLIRHGSEIEARRRDSAPRTPVSVLLAISRLRNSKSHRNADKKKAFSELGICEKKMLTRWGEALDIVYDKSSDALCATTQALEAGIGS